ncbi:MAG: Hsp20/alpha crystallin family protein [Desulfatibacillaceae bacterium]
MDYIKIRFGRNLGQIHEQLGRSIEQMFRSMNPVFDMSTANWRPQMDVYETWDEIVVTGEMAGIDKDDLVVELDAGALRVTGKRVDSGRKPDNRFHLVEIPYGSFERVIYLPCPVDPEKVTATYNNGMLEIRMLKRGARDPQKVDVESRS